MAAPSEDYRGKVDNPEDYQGVEELRELDLGELKAILSEEIQTASGAPGSTIAEERRLALRAYEGKKYGNEVYGRSEVVLTDTADTIEWILPTLLRMFTNGNRICRFEPAQEGQEENAKTATAGVNHVVMNDNHGFMLLHNWFKDALLSKVGTTKTYTEEKEEPKIERYMGLTDVELEMLMRDDGIEIRGQTERVENVEGQPLQVFDVETINRKKRKRIRVIVCPPEEFRVARRLVFPLDDDAPFTMHQTRMMVSDLLAMGYPRELVLMAETDDSPDWEHESYERYEDEDETHIGLADRPDQAGRRVWVHECYLRVDEDGDGYAEMRKILAIGPTSGIVILDNEMANRHPFSCLCPIPMPHKFHGKSLADIIRDLQFIRTTLLRQMLDNLYLANSPMTEVVEGQANLDDLLHRRAGSVIRVRAPGMIREIETRPFSAMAVQMFEMLGAERENRTGVTRYNQGLDASSLNQTAHGISEIMAAASARIEMIARIFAATGVPDLCRKVFREMIESGMKEFQVKVDGRWATINPSTWDENMHLEVEVGLGVGRAGERIGQMQMILGLQEKLVAGGFGGYLVKPEHFYNAAEKMTEAMGFKIPELFFANPEGQEPPPPTPPPQVIVAEKKAEIEAAKMRLEAERIELDQIKERALVEHRAQELAMKERTDMARIEAEARTRIRVAEIQADATLKAAEKRAAAKPATPSKKEE
jgi:hypothetical protein